MFIYSDCKCTMCINCKFSKSASIFKHKLICLLPLRKGLTLFDHCNTYMVYYHYTIQTLNHDAICDGPNAQDLYLNNPNEQQNQNTSWAETNSELQWITANRQETGSGQSKQYLCHISRHGVCVPKLHICLSPSSTDTNQNQSHPQIMYFILHAVIIIYF